MNNIPDAVFDRVDEIIDLINPIAITTGRTWSKEQYVEWTKVLLDLPTEAIRRGVAQWVATSESGWPMPATVRRFALESMEGVPTSVPDAWAGVLACVKRFGIYGRAEAKKSIPPLVWRAIGEESGWEHLCEMTADQRPTFAAQFRQRYGELRENENRMRMLPEHLRPRINNTPVRSLESGPSAIVESVKFGDVGDAESDVEKRRIIQIQAARRAMAKRAN